MTYMVEDYVAAATTGVITITISCILSIGRQGDGTQCASAILCQWQYSAAAYKKNDNPPKNKTKHYWLRM